jgi:hypothetical protein
VATGLLEGPAPAPTLMRLEGGSALLIIIDEAGMAHTLSLDTAVQFAIDLGASVRLVGVINNSPRSEPVASSATSRTCTARCTLPSYTASPTRPKHKPCSPCGKAIPAHSASISIHGRVHVGDLAKITEDGFSAWISDRVVGLDAIMLAPTRELVADLNRQARDHRRDGASAGQEVRLAGRKSGVCRRHDHYPLQRSTPSTLGHRLYSLVLLWCMVLA